MTTNQTDGTVSESGAGTPPESPASPQTSQPLGGEVTTLLTALEGKLEERFKTLESRMGGLREVQGKIDSSQKSFQEQLALFNQIKAQNNYSDEQALGVMQKQSAEEARWQAFEQKLNGIAERIGGAGNTSPAQQMVAEVLADFKLDPKDTYVASQLQGKQFASRAEAEAFAGRLLRDKVYSPNPTQAQAASTPANSVSNAAQDMISRLTALQADPLNNQKEIKALTAELDKVNWGQQ